VWKFTELPPDVRDFCEEKLLIENVKRVVFSLEVCSYCQRVSECVPSPFVNQHGIWYCRRCFDALAANPAAQQEP